jgi:predicted dehydrogenase
MLRVGLIGTGVISDLNVLGYIYSDKAEVVAVSDTDEKLARKKLKKWGLLITKYYKDYQEMVDKENLDIVEILTPHHLHAPMTEYCAKAKVPGISVQKPLAENIRNCDKMIEICKQCKVKLKLFENFRFYPPCVKAKELLDDGIIGEPISFRIITVGGAGPGWKFSYIKSYLWRVNTELCGGGPIVYDDGIHKFSMALWLMDEDVDKVYAWVDFDRAITDAPAFIMWKYKTDPKKEGESFAKYGTMEFNTGLNMYYPSNYYSCDEFIEITGTKGMMKINQCTSGGNVLSNFPQFPPIVTYVNGKVQAHGQDLPRDWRYSFINSTQHFIDCMINDGTPIYTGEQGKRLCQFAKAPYISTQEGREIFVDEITAENELAGICNVEKYFKLGKVLKIALKYGLRILKDRKRSKKIGQKVFQNI